MPLTHRTVGNEKGMALVMAMLVLVILTAAAMSLLASTNAQSKQAAVEGHRERALALAEAGVAEALSRLRSGDIPGSDNPAAVTQVFNAAVSELPVLGPDSIAIPTRQPAGEWLAYSTRSRSSDALTIRFKTTPDRSAILRYDPSHTPCVNTASGNPIYEIRSTGAVGIARARVEAEVVAQPLDLSNLRAALVTAGPVRFEGPGHVAVDGMNHLAETPASAGVTGPSPDHYTGADDRAAVWSNHEVRMGRGALAHGSGTAPVLDRQGLPFYSGPWDALSMTRRDFDTWTGAPVNQMPAQPKGVTRLDDNGVAQDRSGSWTLDDRDGEGVLYVDGDLTIEGDVTWRGLIYVEGDLNVRGHFWVLGATIVRGQRELSADHVNATFLWSSDAIQKSAGRHGGTWTQLAWRQVD